MKAAISEKALRKHERREQSVRMIKGCKDRGDAQRAAAKATLVRPRTIRRWLEKERKGELRVQPLGRPAKILDRPTRQGLISLLVALGPVAGVPSVRALFGDMVPYRMITCFKQRLARVRCKRRGRHERRLEWFEPGRVWAMDFTQPKAKLPGKNNKLFMVRDLASGARLASVPCRGERAMRVIKTLEALFSVYGAPVVIKHDNGGAFLADKTQDMLEEHGVRSLPSPVYRPQYNGSCERSLGWAKIRTEHIAEREGHAGSWTAENLEQARVQANATLRPWGPRGPTPGEAFEQRRPITPAEREAFNETVDQRIKETLLTYVREDGTLIVDTVFEVIERRAVTHALRKHGYLQIWRGRESAPLSE